MTNASRVRYQYGKSLPSSANRYFVFASLHQARTAQTKRGGIRVANKHLIPLPFTESTMNFYAKMHCYKPKIDAAANEATDAVMRPPGRGSAVALRQTAFPAAKARSQWIAEAAAGEDAFAFLVRANECVSPLARLASGESTFTNISVCIMETWQSRRPAAFFMLTLVRSRMATAHCCATRLIRMIARIVVKTLRVRGDAFISLTPLLALPLPPYFETI